MHPHTRLLGLVSALLLWQASGALAAPPPPAGDICQQFMATPLDQVFDKENPTNSLAFRAAEAGCDWHPQAAPTCSIAANCKMDIRNVTAYGAPCGVDTDQSCRNASNEYTDPDALASGRFFNFNVREWAQQLARTFVVGPGAGLVRQITGGLAPCGIAAPIAGTAGALGNIGVSAGIGGGTAQNVGAAGQFLSNASGCEGTAYRLTSQIGYVIADPANAPISIIGSRIGVDPNMVIALSNPVVHIAQGRPVDFSAVNGLSLGGQHFPGGTRVQSDGGRITITPPSGQQIGRTFAEFGASRLNIPINNGLIRTAGQTINAAVDGEAIQPQPIGMAVIDAIDPTLIPRVIRPLPNVSSGLPWIPKMPTIPKVEGLPSLDNVQNVRRIVNLAKTVYTAVTQGVDIPDFNETPQQVRAHLSNVTEFRNKLGDYRSRIGTARTRITGLAQQSGDAGTRARNALNGLNQAQSATNSMSTD